MPYVTRKKVRPLYIDPLVLKVDLAEDKFAKHYPLHYGSTNLIRGKVSLIVDEKNFVKCVVNKDFEFHVDRQRYYSASSNVPSYHIWLVLPPDLVSDFAIDAGMGIELILKEVRIGEEFKQIFSAVVEQGSMDFEPKGLGNEVIDSSESLIAAQFVDEFYDKLVFEINTSFRMRLFTATMVLVRKLFENLIIDLLRQKYGMGPTQIELFYSRQDNGFQSLSKLIHNLGTKIEDFRPYGLFKLDKEKEDFLNFLWDMNEKGNASAHSIETFLDSEKINLLKTSINRYSGLLVRLTQKIKETPT